MKALLLTSALGLTLLANTAVAAVSAEDSSVWRRVEANPVEHVEKDTKKPNDWKQTQFSPVDSLNKNTKKSQIWRTIRF